MNIYLTSLGCRLNQAERESWERALRARGQQIVGDPADAEWAIVNTCTVTHIAARKSRQLVRHLHRANAALRIAVTGCCAEISPDMMRKLAGVALVVPNREKDNIIEYLLASTKETENYGKPLHPDAKPHQRTRAIIKVQDGCDHHCTYCIVTVARGSQRSIWPDLVLDDVAQRVAEGYREIVLTGVSLGAYGRDSAPGAPLPPSKGWSLARLVSYILAHTAVERLRLSSIEPWDVTPDLIALWDSPRLCRHLHLSLQSGCDTTLRRMGRPYTTETFRALAHDLRARINEISITTDVIVGFPGETNETFEQSLAFVDEIGFSRLHVFRYSARAGTAAPRMPNQVPPDVAQARHREMSILGKRLARRYHETFLGRRVSALMEQRHARDGIVLWQGLTDTYIRVETCSARDMHNTIVDIHCEQATASGLSGTICRSPTTE